MALRSSFLKFRNRLLADPKFLAFAQRFPLTRPVARAKSRALFDLLAGFSYSQVLYACVCLNVLQYVGQAGILPDELASKIGLTPTNTDILVRAAVALDILAWDKARIILGPHGAALLAQPWIMRFVEHHAHFYRDLENPVDMLRGQSRPDGLSSYWTYDQSPSNKKAYSELMAASQQAVSQQILGAFKCSRYQNILDIGGGTGAFLQSIGQINPRAKLHLFDLPEVIALAPAMANLTSSGGDFLVDTFPPGMDLITLVRVVHDHDDKVIVDLLRRIRLVCSPSTTLLIAEPFAGNRANAKVTDAYFNFYFAAMGQGRTRSPTEIAALAALAGFAKPKIWRTDMPLISGVMTLSPTL